jgi:hypothetical protein
METVINQIVASPFKMLVIATIAALAVIVWFLGGKVNKYRKGLNSLQEQYEKDIETCRLMYDRARLDIGSLLGEVKKLRDEVEQSPPLKKQKKSESRERINLSTKYGSERERAVSEKAGWYSIILNNKYKEGRDCVLEPLKRGDSRITYKIPKWWIGEKNTIYREAFHTLLHDFKEDGWSHISIKEAPGESDVDKRTALLILERGKPDKKSDPLDLSKLYPESANV